jgi:hypothetical protein
MACWIGVEDQCKFDKRYPPLDIVDQAEMCQRLKTVSKKKNSDATTLFE